MTARDKSLFNAENAAMLDDMVDKALMRLWIRGTNAFFKLKVEDIWVRHLRFTEDTWRGRSIVYAYTPTGRVRVL